MKASDYFGKSRFFKAADLDDGPKKLRIKAVSEVEIKPGEVKPVAWFTNDDRGLVLNITNLRTLADEFGDDMGSWANKIVVLFGTPVDFRGKMVPGLRVRIPPPKGNGQAAAAAPDPELETKDEAPPAKPKTLAEDLDDNIPWK
jgi:hypothetical protein